MIVKSVAMQAYQNALKAQESAFNGSPAGIKKPQAPATGFMDTLKSSLEKVNDMASSLRNRMMSPLAAPMPTLRARAGPPRAAWRK